MTTVLSTFDRNFLELCKLRGSWIHTEEQYRELHCDLHFLTYFPSINPLDLLRAVEVAYLPVLGSTAALDGKFAELNFPSNAKKRCLHPNKPIEEAGTLISYRKHRSGKWIALAMPVWGFEAAATVDCVEDVTLDQLKSYNALFSFNI